MTDQDKKQASERQQRAGEQNRAAGGKERDIEERRKGSDSTADRERTAENGNGGSSDQAT